MLTRHGRPEDPAGDGRFPPLEDWHLAHAREVESSTHVMRRLHVKDT